jgi:Clostripain family.
MSNFEVAYQAEPYVKYIVSSEESEPGEGWPYNSILDILDKNPGISTPEFCCEMVKTYTKAYNEWGQSNVTQSAFDLSKVKDTAKSLDLLAKALIDQMPDVIRTIGRAQNKSKSFFYYTLWDASHFCKVLSGLTQESNVNKAAQNVVKEFEANSGKFILAESHLGKDYDQCCGASVYLIPPPHNVSKYYTDLEFSKDCKNWPLMLQKYHEY